MSEEDNREKPLRARSYDETMQKIRAYVAAHPPQDPPEDAPPDTRRVYWMMREVSFRMKMQIAASRRERAEHDLERQARAAEAGGGTRDAVAYFTKGSTASYARETRETGGDPEWRLAAVETRLESVDTRLESIEVRLTGIEGHLKTLATRVELESFKDDINMIADGNAATSDKLNAVVKTLASIESRFEHVQLRVARLERR